MTNLPMPVELTGADLDAVAAGQGGVGTVNNPIITQGGLVNVGLSAAVGLSDVLNHNTVLSNNNVGVAVSVLGITL